ncbi:MAG TPA: L-threonylcarbamoyladenylate synthase [Chloroflexota bacterium]
MTTGITPALPTPILDGRRPDAIVEIVRLIRGGGVAAIATDTGYALSASLFHPEAVDRVFAMKQRDPRARLPVLVGTAADLPLVARDISASAWHLIEHYWPGPLTLVLPAKAAVPRPVTGGRETVGVRVPGGKSCLQVLESLGEPVTGTSANISGRPGARTASEVLDQLSGAVDAVLEDDNAVIFRAPSTVIEIADRGIEVHRVGALDAESLRRAAGMRVGATPRLPTRYARR